MSDFNIINVRPSVYKRNKTDLRHSRTINLTDRSCVCFSEPLSASIVY